MNKSREDIFEALFLSCPALLPLREDISRAYHILRKCALAKAKIMVCGNGGSAADSEHIVGELMKGFNMQRPLSFEDKEKFKDIPGGKEIADKLQCGIKAISLVSQTGLISAFANDVDAALVFAQQVFAYADSKYDVLLALTTSGNSLNVVNAAKTARAAGIQVVAITGETGGEIATFADAVIRLPAKEPFAVQEYTLPVYHALCAMLEADNFQA
ncbi:MAG: SIS domain-containing protein [Clostridia bacterium]|nr:SIS domain-containing protein [Clostridia bacterium]